MSMRLLRQRLSMAPPHCLSLGGALLLCLFLSPVGAQDTAADPHSGHGASDESMQGMQHDDMSMEMDMDMSMDDVNGMDMSPGMAPGMSHDGAAMKKDGMPGMESMSMQGGKAPADARDPHAYAAGYDFGPFPLRFADRYNFGAVLLDRLEAVRTDDGTAAVYDLQAWYGRDYDRVVLKAEGDVDEGEIEAASTELLWGHALAPFWDTLLGVRYDTGEAPDQAWLAFGVQGLAPYWFEVDATVYIAAAGRAALSVEAEYELLLTQKLVLQPRLEVGLNAKDDGRRSVGAGLSEVAFGLRLRYEISRQFAPYIGVEWASKYGGTADYARAAGQDRDVTRGMAGLRVWF